MGETKVKNYPASIYCENIYPLKDLTYFNSLKKERYNLYYYCEYKLGFHV